MKRAFLFSLTLLSLPFISSAQHDTIRADRAQITDFYIAIGQSNYPVFNMAQSNFKEIVPKSQLLSGDLMNVDYNNYNDTAGGFSNTVNNQATYLQAGVTLRLRNREFRNAGPWIKLGLSYFSRSTILSSGVFRSTQSRNDSAYYLGSTPVNQVTEQRKELTYVYSCESINFEGTLIYKLNPEGIFSLYGGPGAILGLNYGGKAELTATTKSIVTDYIANSFGHDGAMYRQGLVAGQEVRESFDKGPNFSAGLFINVGLDVRLGHRFDVIKNMHAFFEAKPMFRMYGVKGAGMQSGVLLVGNVGLRYEL